jgi:hypothetical protein
VRVDGDLSAERFRDDEDVADLGAIGPANE